MKQKFYFTFFLPVCGGVRGWGGAIIQEVHFWNFYSAYTSSVDKQCRPRSDAAELIRVYTVCLQKFLVKIEPK